ncbi:hypothetical protein NC661_06800 [Aquibacillus koreensis]|uniref:NAD(P)-binding domain-containing protein n=1 Tax=Aquibacillus koreensis TaxID=279446 RepID=A0A9X3WK35_9BACI|nr:hypothetical protein [Aquibacillus koreensis]MCT2535640.1 hypothetical protein [Aquibacillus koreensis]MDC3420075.1 hypothetical protein [Aquibacillus koreensis]
MYVIVGCNHWIGYHLANKLLDEGSSVIGLDSDKAQEQQDLVLFFGRNSAFEHVQSVTELYKQHKKEKFEAIFQLFQVDNKKQFEKFDAKKWFQLQIEDSIDQAKQVELPLLYGEWMPREKDGFYKSETFYSFSSKEFQRDGVYIGDFVEALIQLSKSNHAQETISFKPLRKDVQPNREEKNTIYIRESLPLEQRFKKLQQHYKQFSSLYP